MELGVSVKHVAINGRRIGYREAGTGPAIVFLHGLGGNSASWHPQFTALANSHRVVTCDMPGFGGCELLATSSATTQDFSDLALRFMDALGIEQAIGIAPC